jgi:hypothetical protein
MVVSTCREGVCVANSETERVAIEYVMALASMFRVPDVLA